MIDLVITDEDLEADRRTVEYFHTLRKGNSTKWQRHDAWMACEMIRAKWAGRAARMHPISPSNRWREIRFDHEGTWTCPYMRSLEPGEVAEMFPGALEAFATQCDDIPRSRFVFDRWGGKGGRLRLSVPMTPPDTKHANVTWMPEMQLWRRYSKSIRSRPLPEEGVRFVGRFAR